MESHGNARTAVNGMATATNNPDMFIIVFQSDGNAVADQGYNIWRPLILDIQHILV